MITLNSVYKYIDVEQGERIRIIELNEKFVYVVNIDAVTSMPKKELLSTIQSEVEGEKLIQINDPYAKAIDDKRLSNVQKFKRDEEWEIIRNYWYNNRELLLEREKEENSYKKFLIKLH
nr:hypothetical protein [Clostridium botulinum]